MEKNTKKFSYIDEYFDIKNTFTLPLKAKMYFSIMENLVYKNSSENIPKQFLKIIKLLLKSFEKQTLEEKGYFLKSNILYVKKYLNQRDSENNKYEQQSTINQIQTQCHISQKWMGVSYWADASFKLNKENYRIKIKLKKKQININLKHYYCRKSRKLKNTIVFEAISQQIHDSYRKYTLQLLDSITFTEVYNHVRDCVINYTNVQLVVLVSQHHNQQSLTAFTNSGQVDKALTILNQKQINNYFIMKDKILNKIKKEKLAFKLVDNNIEGTFQVSRNNSENFYKFQRKYAMNFNQLNDSLVFFKRSPCGNLIYYETLQRFSNHIQLGYFKYNLGKKYFAIEFLTIIEEFGNQNEKTVIMKGVENLMISQSIQFLIIKSKKINANTTILTIIGNINFKNTGSDNIIKWFLTDISKIVINQKQQQNITQNFRYQTQPEQIFNEQFYSFASNQPQFTQIQQQNQLLQETLYLKDLGEEAEQVQINDASSNEENNKQTNKNVKDIQTNNTKRKKQIIINENSCLSHHYNFKQRKKDEQSSFQLQKVHFLYPDWIRGKNGGLMCTNKASIDQQKKVVKRILAQMGDNLLKARNIMNISLPVQIFKKESHLKTLARNISYAPLLLDNYINAPILERMKKVIILAISMDCLGISMQKPFNPILGQTYQGYIDGCPIYLQQLNHHPPISALSFYGRGYKITGLVQPRASVGLNSVTGDNPRKITVSFQDGNSFSFKLGNMQINGILFGQRYFNYTGNNKIIHEESCICAQINFGPKTTYYLSRSKEPVDYVYGEIFQMKKQYIHQYAGIKKRLSSSHSDYIEKKLSQFQGTWNEIIKFDNKQVINISKDIPCALVDQYIPLPSDSSFRKDLSAFLQSNMESSQMWKDKLQQIQRNDKKLRQKYGKKKK